MIWVYIHTRICIHTCIRVYTHAQHTLVVRFEGDVCMATQRDVMLVLYVCIHMYTYVYVYLHTHARIMRFEHDTCNVKQNDGMHACIIYMHIHMHIHTYTYRYIHVHIRTCTIIVQAECDNAMQHDVVVVYHLQIFTYIQIHMYIHTYTYTCTHTIIARFKRDACNITHHGIKYV